MSWGAFYEGSSDALYLDVLLPRVLRDMIAATGASLADVPDMAALKLGRRSREVQKVAAEICESSDAFDLVFVHADTGGRELEQQLPARSQAYCSAAYEICGWQPERCITVTPRHETEAWLLADGLAITDALGFSGTPADIGLPANPAAAEKLQDPKRVLASAIIEVAGPRRARRIDLLFPAIAQRQRMEILRQAVSFRSFEARLRQCLQSLAIIT